MVLRYTINLRGVPSTTIILAEFDTARGDGDVSVKVIICEQETHNWGVMNDGIDPAIVMANAITKREHEF